MLLREVVDQLLDQHRLADAGPAEQPDLAALDVRRDQVDALEAGLEDLDLRREVAERRRIAVDRPALDVGRRRGLAVDRLPDHVPQAAERRLPDRDGDRLARVDDVGAAGEPVGRVHRDRAHAVVAEMLLHLRDQRSVRQLDLERGQDLGKAVGEDRVDDDALDLDDLPDAAAGRAGIRHGAPIGVSFDREAPGRAAGDGV